MADIQKPSGINNIWAENGLKSAANPSKIDLGWVVEKPPYQVQNWLDNKQDKFQAHVNQHGIPYKDNETEYQANKSYVVDPISGIVYKCIVTHVNQPVSNPVYWDIAFSPYEAMVPAGFTGHTAAASPPRGWLIADGRAVSRIQYPALFAAIGTIHGNGDGSTTFNLPNLCGVVTRGMDNGRGLDPARSLGSYQGDLFASHAHSATVSIMGAGEHSHNVSGSTSITGEHVHTIDRIRGNANGGGYIEDASSGGTAYSFNTLPAGNHSHSVTGVATTSGQHSHNGSVGVQASGGAETRMKNIALLGIIKY